MKPLELHYSIDWVNFTRRVKTAIPSGWDELTPKQYRRVISTLYSILPQHDKELLILKHLTGVRWSLLLAMLPEDVLFLLPSIRWIFQEMDLSKNLIPFFYCGWRKYYGPGDELSGVTALQWMVADYHFMNYIKNKDREALDLFIATLYHRKNRTFDPDRLAASAKRIKKLSYITKVAILEFYCSIRRQDEKTFTRVFSKSTTGKASNSSWGEVYMDIAESGPFGKLDDVEKQPYGNVLMYMERQLKKREDMEREMEKQRRKGKR